MGCVAFVGHGRDRGYHRRHVRRVNQLVAIPTSFVVDQLSEPRKIARCRVIRGKTAFNSAFFIRSVQAPETRRAERPSDPTASVQPNRSVSPDSGLPSIRPAASYSLPRISTSAPGTSGTRKGSSNC